LVTNAKQHFSTKQGNESFFILFECSQRKKEKYQQVKNQEFFFGLIADHKESLQEITH
jgi:SET domain-containing protein